MAAPTTEEIARYKTLILIAVDEQEDNSGPLSQIKLSTGLSTLDVLWDVIAPQAGSDNGYLQFLHVKREAIKLVIGSIIKGTYQKVGTIQHKALDDKVPAYQEVLKEVQKEIDGYMVMGRLTLDIYEPSANGW